jgi:hypothetical protein
VHHQRGKRAGEREVLHRRRALPAVTETEAATLVIV